MNTPDFEAAAAFIAANARVVDRRRFERMFADAGFGGGSARAVRDAVAAYRNDDGGFGQALEPDCRAPGSQPLAVEMALRIMDEADAWDAELATGACDWLAAVEPAGGGASGAEPSLADWPHAPWWVPGEGQPASVISTGLIAGRLHARGVRHPWLNRATELMWARIAGLDADPADGGLSGGVEGGYEMFGVLTFLQHVPDRDRAAGAFGRVGPLIGDRGLVAMDPDSPGEVHLPLEFAPEPDSMARAVFSEATIKANLDHLAAAQRDDGGWTFNWLAWSPAAEREWRGFLTVDALRVLRANGYLS